MTKKKKNTIMNVLMVVSITAILAAGIILVGSIKGWFDRTPEIVAAEPADAGEAAENGQTAAAPAVPQPISAGKRGSVNIYRSGLAYSLDENVKLRAGDEIETLNLSSMEIQLGESRILLSESTRVSVEEAEDGQLSLELVNGDIFADVTSPLNLKVNGSVFHFEDAVFSASGFYNSGSLRLFAGDAVMDSKAWSAGSYVSILSEESGGITDGAVSITSLNAFELNAVSGVSESRGSFFSPAEAAELIASREAEKQSALEAVFLEGEEEARISAQREAGKAGLVDNGNSNAQTDSGVPTCTIEIRCDTILNNMDHLVAGKDAYVPANGVILATSRLSFNEEETVFDVLKRACSLAGIQIEYSWTPMYNSYYVEGINNLYEFDCGDQSGWMYKVNGWFPNYGCSSYMLEDGDVIVWCYTCNGLGADVGGSVY